VKAKRKLVLATFALIGVALMVGLSWQFSESSKPPEMEGLSVPLLGLDEIKNPEVAKQYGRVGYIEFNTAEGTPRTLYIAKGKEASITILIHLSPTTLKLKRFG